MMEPLQIGWHELKKDTVMHNNDFPTAAWYEDILVKAGRYPIVVYNAQHGEDGRLSSSSPNGAYILYEGTIVDDNFQSLYYGMPISDYDGKKNAGKPSSYHPFYYMFMLASAVMSNPDEFILLPEYEARDAEFVSTYDGKKYTTHDIYWCKAKE